MDRFVSYGGWGLGELLAGTEDTRVATGPLRGGSVSADRATGVGPVLSPSPPALSVPTGTGPAVLACGWASGVAGTSAILVAVTTTPMVPEHAPRTGPEESRLHPL